jgi:hypothetical protein
MPLLNIFRPERFEARFKYRQHPTLVSAASFPPASTVMLTKMSVEKRKSSSARYRALLAQNIAENGFVVMPCTWCSSQGLTCRMLEKVKRCEACVRRGRSCDGSGVPISSRACASLLSRTFLTYSPVDRIMREQRRLKEEEKQAEALLVEYQRKASEALARLSRVRQQREFLVEKGADMVARGLSNMDALEQSEAEESRALLDVQTAPVATDVVDWGAVFSSIPALAPLGDLDSFGGTLPISQGNGGS